jgi:hypothetical protein
MKGVKTIVELAGQYELHPNQITDWKRQLQENSGIVFKKWGRVPCFHLFGKTDRRIGLCVRKHQGQLFIERPNASA